MLGDIYNLIENAFQIGFEIGIPDAKHAVSEFAQTLRAFQIFVGLLGLVVMRTIELDDQVDRLAEEVSDIRTAWRLAAEFQTIQAAISKVRPQLALFVRLATAQHTSGLGKGVAHRFRSPAPSSPSPALRASSPVPGEESKVLLPPGEGSRRPEEGEPHMSSRPKRSVAPGPSTASGFSLDPGSRKWACPG